KPDRMAPELLAVTLTSGVDSSIVAHEEEAGVDRLVERDCERMIVNLLEPRNFRCLALRIVIRAFNFSDIASRREGLFGVHHSGITPDDVICRQLFVIMEISILTELVCIG